MTPPPPRWPSGCVRARSTNSSARATFSHAAGRCAKPSSAICCSRSSSGVPRARARRRWRALDDNDRGLGRTSVAVDESALQTIAMYANGDARSALNLLELSVSAAPTGADGERRVDKARVEQTMQRRALLYDKAGEEHYN